MMKKGLSLLITLIMLLGLLPMNAFALSRPSENEDAMEWERYAVSAEEDSLYEEAAMAYKIAAEKYAELLQEDSFYFGPLSSCYGKAIQLFEYDKKFEEILQCYEALGDAALDFGEYNKAKDAYTKAMETGENLSLDDKHFKMLCEKLGDTLMALEKYRDAASEYYHAIERGDSSDDGYDLLCLKYARSLEADGSRGDPEKESDIGRAFTDAAGHFLARGKAEEAISIMKMGAAHLEKTEEKDSAPKAYSSMVNALANAGREDLAAPLCFEGFDAYGPSHFFATLLSNIARPYYEGIEDWESAGSALDKAGDSYITVGDKEIAKNCYEGAVEYYEKAGNSSAAEAVKEKMKTSFSLGSVLSGGNTWILILIPLIAAALVVVITIRKRK